MVAAGAEPSLLVHIQRSVLQVAPVAQRVPVLCTPNVKDLRLVVVEQGSSQVAAAAVVTRQAQVVAHQDIASRLRSAVALADIV